MEQFKSKAFWKRISVLFLVFFIVYGAMQYFFKEKEEAFFTLGKISSIAVSALFMSVLFQASFKKKIAYQSDVNVGKRVNRGFVFYLKSFLLNTLVFSFVLFIVLFIAYLFLTFFTVEQVHFGKEVLKSVSTLAFMLLLVEIGRYIFDGLQRRLERKVHKVV